jgi:hypothetical protein
MACMHTEKICKPAIWRAIYASQRYGKLAYSCWHAVASQLAIQLLIYVASHISYMAVLYKIYVAQLYSTAI